ncbi:MAG: Formamidopyrimidine-DNA glycosylase [Verrucomicrobiae bacterium]|nr:Formamidopyrimidine-DNA glycosylase [Verrucomicrobiae bacterium]
MPELPEVEIMMRQLRARLRGRVIRRVEVCDSKIKLNGELRGCRINKVWRRAKYIIFDFSHGRHLLVHLRMTGWFEFEPPPKYRLALHAGPQSAYFADSRRFGVVELLFTQDLIKRLNRLGPEPFGADLQVLKRSTRPIKVALLDQTLVAGIGNIYACEALWRARIDPRQRADRLRRDEIRRLERSVVAALQKGLNYGPRIFQVQEFYVYDRAGRSCRRCGTLIRRIVQAQRSTWFCPQCQRR